MANAFAYLLSHLGCSSRGTHLCMTLVILVRSQRLLSHQAPSLGHQFSELYLLPQRLKIKLFLNKQTKQTTTKPSISLVNASKKNVSLSESMWLVSCLHCMPWAGRGSYLVHVIASVSRLAGICFQLLLRQTHQSKY